MLYSSRGQSYFGTSKVDNARPNVSLTNLRDFVMTVPPMDEQARIAEVADAFDERLSRETATLAQAKEAKTALSSALLTGEVRVSVDQEVAA